MKDNDSCYSPSFKAKSHRHKGGTCRLFSNLLDWLIQRVTSSDWSIPGQENSCVIRETSVGATVLL